MENIRNKTFDNAAAIEAQISHESEVQRQHVRIQFPVKVQIGEQYFKAEDWSHSGVAICLDGPGIDSLGLGHDVAVGRYFDAVMEFNFDGYRFSMDIKCEIRFINSAKRRVGCRFVDITPQQVSLLRYFVSAYMSGEVVRVADTIDVASRNNFTKPRNVPSAYEGLSKREILFKKMKKYCWGGLVVVLSIFCLAYLIMAIYEKAFVIKASSAVVTAEMHMVTSPAGGQVAFQRNHTNIAVKKGEPLFSVETLTGSIIGRDSPYEGVLKRYLVENSEAVRKGQALVAVLPEYARPYVIAKVPYQDASRLAQGMLAVLEFEGYDSVISGKIKRVEMFEGQQSARVEIFPDSDVPVKLVDFPVNVSFDVTKKPSAK